MTFLEELAARRRFGMKPGLSSIRRVCERLGNPERNFPAIHVAGTNGKGAVCATLSAALASAGLKVGRYTSPHLVRLNERFFLEEKPVGDDVLDRLSVRVAAAGGELTFFEALTAVAFLLYAEAKPDFSVLECGLGGRFDATNICRPALAIITRIGLDHCEWLGDTIEKIAAEKAGIIKPGVPVVLAQNEPSVRAVVEARAKELNAPFYYAPELAGDLEVPGDFSLAGSFNRENAVTAIAALKVLERCDALPGKGLGNCLGGFRHVVWPGRFQRIGNFIVDGAHNPPAARALATALQGVCPHDSGVCPHALSGVCPPALSGVCPQKFDLVVGFCGDKDVDEVLRILSPLVRKAYAVRTNNPRSLPPEKLVEKLQKCGIEAYSHETLQKTLTYLGSVPTIQGSVPTVPVLICGSLFLAGEALVELGAYPWGSVRFDASESLRAEVLNCQNPVVDFPNGIKEEHS